MSLQKNLIIGSTTVLSLVTLSSVALAETAPAIVTLDPVACSTALDSANTAEQTALDVKNTAMKSALTARTNALKTAIALTDLTARKTAIQSAEKEFRDAMKSADDAFRNSTKTTKDALKTACPGLGRGMMMGEKMMGGPNEDPRIMKGLGQKGHGGFMSKMRGLFSGKKGARGAMTTEVTEDR